MSASLKHVLTGREAKPVAERRAWKRSDILGLSLVPTLKKIELQRLVKHFRSFEDALAASPPALAKAGINAATLFDSDVLTRLRESAHMQAERCAASGADFVTFWDDSYPHLLREMFYPPLVLYVRGKLQCADACCISIVGTRRCTDYGRSITAEFAAAFARQNIVVVSGLAQGIDTAAHKATLKACGITYAVVASGVDCIGPWHAEETAQAICEAGGAVLSEYPCGTRALRPYFPQRNRIISGLSRATLVAESGGSGGALITAKFALDQNRELFAVPGSIKSAQSIGSNRLIQRLQAAAALTPKDMLEALGIKIEEPFEAARPSDHKLSAGEKRIYAELGADPLHVDVIAERCRLPVHVLQAELLELEFKSVIRQLPGKHYIRTTP